MDKVAVALAAVVIALAEVAVTVLAVAVALVVDCCLPSPPEEDHRLPAASMSYTRQVSVLSIIFGRGSPIFPNMKSYLWGEADTTRGDQDWDTSSW